METIRTGGQETTLGLQVGIDIGVTEVGYDLTPWFQQHIAGKPQEWAERELNKYNNTCFQVKINAQAFKPPRSKR